MKPDLSAAELLRRYLATIPGCSEGEGRDKLVFATACKVIERFDLTDDELLDALVAWDAEVNRPPVGERMVIEKFRSALRKTQYDPALANSRVPRLDRQQATRRPNLREVEPKEPAHPLPTEESFERMRQGFLTSDKPVAVEAREWLASLGIDPSSCGWAASTLTYQDAKDRGFGHDAALAITGVRFLVPIRDPITGALLDVRRIATGPFSRDDIDGRFKALPWANGHGQARVYRWDDLATRTDELVWCEGEKDCEVLRAHGFIAISNSCGCGGWRAAVERIPAELLDGKRFILLPDADKAGRDTAPKVADELLARGAAEVRIATWPADSPSGFDVTDFFTGGGTAPELQAMLDMAEEHNFIEPETDLVIATEGKQLREYVDDAVTALSEANNPPVMFLRSGRIVRVLRDETGWPIIGDVGEHALRGRLARIASWTGSRGRPIDPPAAVGQTILHEPNLPLPPLVGITQTPTMRADGTVLTDPGYDFTTQLVYAPPPELKLAPVPVNPTADQVAAARDMLLDLVAEFPFVDEASRANLLALWLTPVIRAAVRGPVPMAVVDAPSPGTGKSLLVEVVCRTIAGRSTAMTAPGDEDEWRKRLTSLLLNGASVIVIDNVRAKLASDQLASAITADWWEDRELGRSGMVRVQQRATWVATGNNIALAGDLPRRCYWIRLDARVARPWERTKFAIRDIRRHVDQHRGELLAAMLTVARSWWSAGCPKVNVRPLGGFESWTNIVAGVLAHAGVDGLLANQQELYEVADDGSAEVEGFLRAWHDEFGDTPMRVAQIIDACDTNFNESRYLREALPSWALNAAGHPDARRLGNNLRTYLDRRYGEDGIRLCRAEFDGHSKTARWCVRIDAGSAGTSGDCLTQRVENGESPKPICRGGVGEYPQDPQTPQAEDDPFVLKPGEADE